MSAQETTKPPPEPHVAMPRGGLAVRCKRIKKDGQQCGRAARAGHRMCGVHGAGYAAREARGERKKAGRPVVHALYSSTPSTSIVELMEEVAQLEGVLTNSDRDLITLKAAEVFQLGQLEAHAPKVEKLGAELARLADESEVLATGQVTPERALRFVRDLAEQRAPLTRLKTLIAQVADISEKVIRAHEARAATGAKLAEARGIEAAMEVASASRTIWHALAGDDENLRDALDDAMRRRLCGPRHLELPPLMQLDFVVEPLVEEAPSR